MKEKSYEEFVEKFKPKKTTDDCYTPPGIYAVVRDWACKEYGIDPDKIVRPFYPGGDYEHYDYPEGAVVLDNPPFSILAKITAFLSGAGHSVFSVCAEPDLLFGKDLRGRDESPDLRREHRVRKRRSGAHLFRHQLRRGCRSADGTGADQADQRGSQAAVAGEPSRNCRNIPTPTML